MLGTISVAVMLPTKIEISLGPDLAATLQGSGSSGLAADCFVKLVTNLVFAALADTPRRGEEDMSIGGKLPPWAVLGLIGLSVLILIILLA
jgi:hypothetical protein